MIPCKRLTPTARLPVRGSEGAAAYDLFADGEEGTIYGVRPGETIFVPTGLAIDLSHELISRSYPDGSCELDYSPTVTRCALILPRSGWGCKKGLRPGNTPGLIDPDYRGEIVVCLRNDSHERQMFFSGDRIAQMLIIPFYYPDFGEVEDLLTITKRGDGSFGSTGG